MAFLVASDTGLSFSVCSIISRLLSSSRRALTALFAMFVFKSWGGEVERVVPKLGQIEKHKR